MSQTNYTDGEIISMFKNRDGTRRKAVKILSELEACDFMEMRDRLVRLGLLEENEFASTRRTKNYGWLPCRENKPWSKTELNEVVKMRRKGYTLKEVANMFDRTIGSIQTAICVHKEWIHE